MKVQKTWWLLSLTIVACALTLLLSACGGSGGSGAANEVDMGVADFKQHALTIKAGETVHFVDPMNGGGVHVLCFGKDEQCVPQTDAPAKLNVSDGVQFQPGDPTLDVTFPTAGVYTVVCTIHPGMVVTITVQ